MKKVFILVTLVCVLLCLQEVKPVSARMIEGITIEREGGGGGGYDPDYCSPHKQSYYETLSIGSTESTTFTSSGDYDCYKFKANQNGLVRVKFTGNSKPGMFKVYTDTGTDITGTMKVINSSNYTTYVEMSVMDGRYYYIGLRGYQQSYDVKITNELKYNYDIRDFVGAELINDGIGVFYKKDFKDGAGNIRSGALAEVVRVYNGYKIVNYLEWMYVHTRGSTIDNSADENDIVTMELIIVKNEIIQIHESTNTVYKGTSKRILNEWIDTTNDINNSNINNYLGAPFYDSDSQTFIKEGTLTAGIETNNTDYFVAKQAITVGAQKGVMNYYKLAETALKYVSFYAPAKTVSDLMSTLSQPYKDLDIFNKYIRISNVNDGSMLSFGDPNKGSILTQNTCLNTSGYCPTRVYSYGIESAKLEKTGDYIYLGLKLNSITENLEPEYKEIFLEEVDLYKSRKIVYTYSFKTQGTFYSDKNFVIQFSEYYDRYIPTNML